MDLRQLAYFLKVVELGNLTRAAEDLGIAQPSLTKAIRQIEESVRVQLLHRLPRGVAPTEAGERLASRARMILLQVNDAEKEISGHSDGLSGVVTIGAGPAWLRRFLPEAVGAVTRQHRAVQCRIVGGFDDGLLEQLRSGALDFVVAELPSPDRHRDIEARALTSDRLVVVADGRHPLAKGRARPEDLLSFGWAMPPSATQARRRMEAMFAARNLTSPDIRIETASMAFLLGVLHNSELMTFTVESTLDGPEASGLVALDVVGFESAREAGIMLRKDAWLSPATRLVIAELTRLCAVNGRN